MKWYFPLLLVGFFVLGWQANTFLSQFMRFFDSADVSHGIVDDVLSDTIASPVVSIRRPESNSANDKIMYNFRRSIEQQRYAESIDYFDQLSLDSDQVMAAEAYLFEYMDTLQSANKLAAERELSQVYADYYQHPRFYYRLAQVMYRQGETISAIEWLYQLKTQQTSAISLRLSQQIALWVDDTFNAMYDAQQYSVLLAWLDQLEMLDADNGKVVLLRAQVLETLKQWENALSEYQHLATYDAYDELAGSKLREIERKLKEMNPDEIVIPLKRIGKHYAASVMIDESKSVELLLDTGASLTVIKQSVMSGMYLGSGKIMQFNTANGMTQGEVFRVSLFSLESVSLSDFELAVLDMPDMTNADGLLGMNFFEKFQFHIDQKENVLRLLPRSVE